MYINLRYYFLVFFSLFYLLNTNAMVKHANEKKDGTFLSKGVIIGGIAGKAFSLLSVNRKYGKKSQMERVSFEIGDEYGVPIKGITGFFHVEIDSENKIMNLDLSQLQLSKMTKNEIIERISSSPYLKVKDVVYDPEDKSTLIQFIMKRNLKVEVFSSKSVANSAKIIIDILPQSLKGNIK